MKQVHIHDSAETDLKNNLIRIGDLINLDGPLLSLFKDYRNDDLYIFAWVDSNDITNRWLIYKVSPHIINQFLHKYVSYKYLFEISFGNSNHFYADINNTEEMNYLIHASRDIPKEYLPTEEILFHEEDAKNYEMIIFTINKIIFKDESELFKTLNHISDSSYFQFFNNKFVDAQNQVQLIFEGTFENALPPSNSNKLEPQQNVRENNKLPKKA